MDNNSNSSKTGNGKSSSNSNNNRGRIYHCCHPEMHLVENLDLKPTHPTASSDLNSLPP